MDNATELYRFDEKPPAGTVVFSAFQHLALIAPIGLVFPLLVVSRAGAEQNVVHAVLVASMLAQGIAIILQCMRWRGVGSGYLAPAIFTGAYLPPSLMAAEMGGLGLVFGMTLFGGTCQMLLSCGLRRLRPYLPTEIAGLAVTMIGVLLGMLGFRLLFGLPTGSADETTVATAYSTSIGLLCLAGIIVLTIWGPRKIRIYAVLISLIGSWFLAAALGYVDSAVLREGSKEGLVWLPTLPLITPKFEPGLAVEFFVAAVACSLRAVGDLTTCQKINDPAWQRPEMNTVKGGVFADGLGTFVAGALGTVGLNTFSGSIGLSAATGVMARRVGFALGIIFISLAFFPGAIALAGSIPMPLTGAILLFASSFILINGVQVILSRLLDNRKSLVIGLAFIFGLSHDVFPDFYASLPPRLLPVTGSPLVVALVVAISLNLVFRLGIARRAQLTLAPGKSAVDAVHAFCEKHGAAWGARRDVMHRVTTALVEFAESADTIVDKDETATIDLSYDETRIDARIRYGGTAMPSLNRMPATPGPPDLTATDDLPAHIPVLIIGRMADNFDTGQNKHGHWLRMSFDH